MINACFFDLMAISMIVLYSLKNGLGVMTNVNGNKYVGELIVNVRTFSFTINTLTYLSPLSWIIVR